MRYRLRTLFFVVAVLPPLIAGVWLMVASWQRQSAMALQKERERQIALSALKAEIAKLQTGIAQEANKQRMRRQRVAELAAEIQERERRILIHQAELEGLRYATAFPDVAPQARRSLLRFPIEVERAMLGEGASVD